MTTTALPICEAVLVDEGFGHPDAAQVRHLELPATADAPRQARLFVWGGPPPLADDDMALLSLLTSELVTNAVLHARTPLTYCLLVTVELVLVVVVDGNQVLPAPTSAGRGLQLVSTIAAGWGARPAPGGGKAVWFTMRRPNGAAQPA